jgi:hypothetical protein
MIDVGFMERQGGDPTLLRPRALGVRAGGRPRAASGARANNTSPRLWVELRHIELDYFV